MDERSDQREADDSHDSLEPREPTEHDDGAGETDRRGGSIGMLRLRARLAPFRRGANAIGVLPVSSLGADSTFLHPIVKEAN